MVDRGRPARPGVVPLPVKRRVEPFDLDVADRAEARFCARRAPPAPSSAVRRARLVVALAATRLSASPTSDSSTATLKRSQRCVATALPERTSIAFGPRLVPRRDGRLLRPRAKVQLDRRLVRSMSAEIASPGRRSSGSNGRNADPRNFRGGDTDRATGEPPPTGITSRVTGVEPARRLALIRLQSPRRARSSDWPVVRSASDQHAPG